MTSILRGNILVDPTKLPAKCGSKGSKFSLAQVRRELLERCFGPSGKELDFRKRDLRQKRDLTAQQLV